MVRIDEYVIGFNTQKGAQEISHPTVRLMRNHVARSLDLDPEFMRRLCTAIEKFGSAVAHRQQVSTVYLQPRDSGKCARDAAHVRLIEPEKGRS